MSAIIIKVIDLTHSGGKRVKESVGSREYFMEYTVNITTAKVLNYICSMGPPNKACLPVPSN